MNDPKTEYWTIAPKSLFDLVNDKRRLRSKTPIDHGTIRTRLTLKCGVICPGMIDFSGEEIRLSTELMPRLESTMNELFDLYLDGALKRYCKFYSPREEMETAFAAQASLEAEEEMARAEEAKSSGLGGMLRRLFHR